MNKSIKSFLAIGAVIIALGATGAYTLSRVAAADNTTVTTTVTDFMSRLATKLGISSDTLQQAVTDTRSETHNENITAALTAGTLTQAQADVLNQIETYKASLTDAQRQAEMDARRTQMESLKTSTETERQAAMQQLEDQEIKDLAAAISVDEATVKDAMTAAKTAGLGCFGGKGFGGEMGRGRGGMHGGGMGMGFGL
jgi:hypothetical protein